jgi:hypothetical protein
MPDYVAKLVNCVLPQRRRLDVSIGGLAFELHQDLHLPTSLSELRGSCRDTTDVWVRDVSEAKRPAVRSVLDHLSEMLSFATECRVRCYREEYPAISGLVHIQTVTGTILHFRPPFQENAEVHKFIEQCYPQYVLFREPRRLHVAIDYIYNSLLQGLAR